MRQEQRKIQVDSKLQISSVWAIPEGYEAPTSSAIILAHGAGNNMEHSFISYFHQAFAEAGLLSIKFNFPYTDAGRKAPDRMELLQRTWQSLVKAVREDSRLAPKHLFLAGKSMGGRVASHLVAQGEACDGLVFLGYPLHPAKRTDKPRVEHWSQLSCPILFIEGTRDSLCDLDLLKAMLPQTPSSVTLHVVEGGDHSFKVPKSVEKTQEVVLGEIRTAIVSWLTDRTTDGVR
jgi:predicted alpha/beta-hydrolase family hydrolase